MLGWVNFPLQIQLMTILIMNWTIFHWRDYHQRKQQLPIGETQVNIDDQATTADNLTDNEIIESVLHNIRKGE